MSINLKSPSTYTTGFLITDTEQTPGGSNDSIPRLTQANDEPVDAALEVNSIGGGFLPPRMTEAQRDELNASPGLTVFNTDTDQLNIYTSADVWEVIGGAVGGGNVSVINPPVTVGNIAVFENVNGQLIGDRGVNILQVPAPAPLIPRENSRTSALVTVNQIGNLGHVQFINDVGLIFVDSLIPVQFITNDFGPDVQACSLFTGGLPGASTTPSALVELQSETGALVVSRMANNEVTALFKTPGMVLYNTEISSYVLFQDTTAGICIGGNGTSGDNLFVGYLGGPQTNSYSGIQNTGVGTQVLSNMQNTNGTVAIGHSAAFFPTKVTDCTFIGTFADTNNDGITNSTAIGANTVVNSDNCVVLGNSCYVGIGNSSPAYSLDVENINSQCGIRLVDSLGIPNPPPSGSGVLYVSGSQPYFLDPTGVSTLLLPSAPTPSAYPPTYNNQLSNISKGYNESGFGGGSVGSGNLTMSSSGTQVVNLLGFNANSASFIGSAFDGRYLYLVPSFSNGQITRYDTTGTITSAGSYSFFDTTTVNANSNGFSGAVFDGRFIYFVPYYNGVAAVGQITRYDTTLPFTSAGSYAFFNTTAVNANSRGFLGGVFDGRYIYLSPQTDGVGYQGQVTRYDTTLPFTSAGSYSFFDTTTVNANSQGFGGSVFDGRYVYFIPQFNNTLNYFGQITRYDTTLSFTSAASYSVFDTSTVNSNSKGFYGAVFDGRYIYLVPNQNVLYHGQVTRYDTTLPFTSGSSYSFFDTTTVNANSKGFFGAVFDGRYIYYVPNFNGAVSGQVTRFDITKPFASAASYSVFNTATVNPGSTGFFGAMYDGTYVYFIPGQSFLSRINAYSGPQLLPFNQSYEDPLYNNHVALLSEGNNSGSFGGSAVGSGNITMSDQGISVYNTVLVNANSRGFFGSAFDGRYLYLIPNIAGVSFSGQITRYDTRLPINALSSYTVFNTASVDANSVGFFGSAFDGRYLYLVPGFNSGYMTRYDTTTSFTERGSYSFFNSVATNANSFGFFGAVFDGRYVYYVPNSNGQVTRYDTTASFTTAGSYAFFNTNTLDARSKGFMGGVFDGRYVYFVPNVINGSTYSGLVTRYDTTLSFISPASYAFFDMATVHPNSKGFMGGVFDGRYVYFVPNTANGITDSGQITRYDTTASFTSGASYSVFDTTTANANSKGFSGAVFDGRFIYFVPFVTGQVTRFDIIKPFASAGSYSFYDTETFNANSKRFSCAMYDGNYVYLVPNSGGLSGQITRLNGYSGPQLIPNGGL